MTKIHLKLQDTLKTLKLTKIFQEPLNDKNTPKPLKYQQQPPKYHGTNKMTERLLKPQK